MTESNILTNLENLKESINSDQISNLSTEIDQNKNNNINFDKEIANNLDNLVLEKIENSTFSNILSNSPNEIQPNTQDLNFTAPGLHERIYISSNNDKDKLFQETIFQDYKNCKFVYGKQPDSMYRKRDDKVGNILEILKVFIIGFVFQLFWIRFLGNIIAFFTVFACLIILSLITRKSYENLTGFSRRLFNLFLVLGARTSLFLFGIFRIRKKIISLEEINNIRKRFCKLPENDRVTYNPFYIISNHVSIIDPFVLMWHFGSFSIVCKQAVKNIPFLGQACQLLQCIFVGSNTKETERKLLKREQKYIERITSNDENMKQRIPPQLLIFPEGTTTTGNHIIRFHSGAFKNGQIVQPVFIDYPHKRFNMSWAQLGFSYIIYCFGQVYNSCSIYILPPYVPNEEEKADWKLYAYNVQRTLVEVGNLYRPLHNQVQMSNELFFRNPNKKLEHESKQRENESKFHYRWRRIREGAKEFHRDSILHIETLQTPTDNPTDFVV